ncbi:MAG TPA: hypothetical protein VNN80_00255, partial [Polyangiaceae bacterium]|nr:hypothetical protein [Polyangiaceae bacterium]
MNDRGRADGLALTAALLTLATACGSKPNPSAGGAAPEADAGALRATGSSAGGGAANDAPLGGDTGERSPSSSYATPDAGQSPPRGLPEADVAPAELDVDVFGVLGNRYWLDASVQEVAVMNAPFQPAIAGPFEGDLYSPLGPAPLTFLDHLFVTTGGESAHTADFGKVQVRLIGQSTARPWTMYSLPNFKLDTDEFSVGNRVGGVKHLRLNNAVAGNIFREKLALDLYRALGYPAPRAVHAWVAGSVWGPEVSVPYVVVEAYKPQFCKQRAAELGGGCVNMWELSGDLGGGALGEPDNCQ